MYDITCSIVTYNTPLEDLKKAVYSFIRCSKNIRLFIVDNSKDDKIRFEFIDPNIEYIFTSRNIGYGSAHNIAINKIIGKSKYHLILNPDIEFDPTILNNLFSFMEQRKYVGLSMPKVLYRNGDTQHLCKMLPTPFDLFLRRFLPAPFRFIFKEKLDRYELKQNDYNTILQIPNLSGCFMFIRTEAFFHLGGFDERYFLYMEDTDLCRRINAFYQTIYYPCVSVVHGYSKASYKSFKLLKLHLISSVKYFNKWGWLIDSRRVEINSSVLSNKNVIKLDVQYKHKEEYKVFVQDILTRSSIPEEQYASSTI